MSTAITASLLLPPIHQGKAGLASFLAPPDPLSPARQEFALLEAWLSSTQALQLPLHQVEGQQQPRGREVQRLLLQAHIQRRGLGDIGPTLRVTQETVEVLYTHRRVRQRSLKTIFCTGTIARMSYSRAGARRICPLDKALQLPARSFSYELQKRSIRAAVQGPFHESVMGIAEITGVSIPKRSLEEVLLDAAQDFDAFLPRARPRTGYRLDLGSGGGWQGHSHGQARGGKTDGTARQGPEGQPQTNGDSGHGLQPCPVGAHPGGSGAESVPYRPPASDGPAGSPASREQAGVGQFSQRKSCRRGRGRTRDGSSRPTTEQDAGGAQRWRESTADLDRPDPARHLNPRSASCAGETLEGGLRVPS